VTSYTVSAEWSNGWWVLQAVEAPGAISQVRDLEQADQIREAIAFVTGEPTGDIDIVLQVIAAPADTDDLADDDPEVAAGMARLAELRKLEGDVRDF